MLALLPLSALMPISLRIIIIMLNERDGDDSDTPSSGDLAHASESIF